MRDGIGKGTGFHSKIPQSRYILCKKKFFICITSLHLVDSVRLFSFNIVAFNWHENFVSFLLAETFFHNCFIKMSVVSKHFTRMFFRNVCIEKLKRLYHFLVGACGFMTPKRKDNEKIIERRKENVLSQCLHWKWHQSSSFEFYFLLRLHEDYKVKYNFLVLLSVHQRRKENVLS